MNKRKAFAAIIILLLMSAAVYGCIMAENSAKSENKTRISFNTLPTKSDSINYNYAKNTMEEFMKKNKDVAVSGDEYIYGVNTFLPKISNNLMTTTYKTWFTEIQKIVASRYAADITESVEKYGLDKKMTEPMKKLVTRDGRYYGIPSDVYVLGLLYNRDILAEAGYCDDEGGVIIPQTYDELTEMCVKIKEKTGKYGFVLPTCDNNGGWLFMNIAWSYGTEFIKEVDGRWVAAFDSEEFIQALQWYKDMRWKWDVIPHQAIINREEYTKMFSDGEAAIIMYSLDAFSDLGQVDYGMASMPAGPRGRFALMGGAVWMVEPNATPEQIDACIRWHIFSMGLGDDVSDSEKIKWTEEAKQAGELNKPIVDIEYIMWNNTAEKEKKREKIIGKYVNTDNKGLEDYLAFDKVTLRQEESICCQELYAIIDSVLQEIVSNEDADVAVLAKNAAELYQKKYLNYYGSGN
ncbi:MAG: ABC transporter substrate-binding protein [Monoglobaceae bacterium]